jgi:hypothetical protein
VSEQRQQTRLTDIWIADNHNFELLCRTHFILIIIIYFS